MNIKPNLVLPLATSYNQRGMAGFTNSITNNIDQKKINSFYEPAKNSITGKTTLYLTKRPGVTIDGSSYGTTGQVGYLVTQSAGAVTLSTPWVFSVATNDINVSDSAGTTTIETNAGYAPQYVDHTNISGTDTVVVQLFKSGSAQRIWYASTRASWTQITDGDFPANPTGKMVHNSGFAFIMDTSNKIYNSNLNSVSAYTAGDNISKQIQQDIPATLEKLGDLIVAFGFETMEVFRNAGNPSGSPLISIKDLFQKIGIRAVTTTGATSYSTVANKKLYFIGRRAGQLNNQGLFAWNGSAEEPQKVSSSFIDEILSSTTVYGVERFTFAGQIAIAIRLDLVTAATQRWLMYFPEWNEWFEWNSTVYMPINNGNYYMGVGANQHKLYTFGAADNWQDDGTNFTMRHQFKLPRNGSYRQFMKMAGVVADTDSSANSLNMAFSDDDYATIQTARTIDMTQIDKGITRCGSYHDRAVILTSTNAREVRIESFIARIK